jgi:hypothetical protein
VPVSSQPGTFLCLQTIRVKKTRNTYLEKFRYVVFFTDGRSKACHFSSVDLNCRPSCFHKWCYPICMLAVRLVESGVHGRSCEGGEKKLFASELDCSACQGSHPRPQRCLVSAPPTLAAPTLDGLSSWLHHARQRGKIHSSDIRSCRVHSHVGWGGYAPKPLLVFTMRSP